MQPDIKELSSEYTRAGGYSSVGFRRTLSDDVRFAKWGTQTDDGKKRSVDPNEEPFPWDGASDTRVRLADQIINENVDILCTAFWRGVLRASPTEASDVSQAASVTSLLGYYRDNLMRRELQQEVQLAAQWGQQYGVSVIYCGWEREVSKRMQTFNMDELVQLSAQAEEGTAMAELPGMIKNPDQEDAVVELVQEYLGLNKRRARKAVRELRDNDTTEVPMDHVTRNAPVVTALKMHDDVFIAPETLELKNAPVIFRRQYMTRAELKQASAMYGYDNAWVEQVLNTGGRIHQYDDYPSTQLNSEMGIYDTRGNLFEIVYAYERVVDEDGVPNVWCTVFHPGITQKHAKHEMLDYCGGQYPFYAYRRETLTRRLLDSRGVSEICMTWQTEQKAQRDAMYDRASLTVLPPFVYPARSSQVYRLQPGASIPEMRPNEIRFLEPPKSNPQEALEIVQYVQNQADDYFGRLTENNNQANAQTRRQAMVENWMLTWSEVFGKMFRLVQEYASPEELMRIGGMNPMLPSSPEEISGRFDFRVNFDVRELDQEFMLQKMQIVSQMVLPEDSAGVIDRAALTKFKMMLLDPVLAEMTITDKTGATQQTFDRVKMYVALMSLGNEAQYDEKDPTAGMKLQFLQGILQGNPRYQEQMQSDERFAALMQTYTQALQFQVQQEQNAQVGRIGVQPVSNN